MPRAASASATSANTLSSVIWKRRSPSESITTCDNGCGADMGRFLSNASTSARSGGSNCSGSPFSARIAIRKNVTGYCSSGITTSGAGARSRPLVCTSPITPAISHASFGASSSSTRRLAVARELLSRQLADQSQKPCMRDLAAALAHQGPEHSLVVVSVLEQAAGERERLAAASPEDRPEHPSQVVEAAEQQLLFVGE